MFCLDFHMDDFFYDLYISVCFLYVSAVWMISLKKIEINFIYSNQINWYKTKLYFYLHQKTIINHYMSHFPTKCNINLVKCPQMYDLFTSSKEINITIGSDRFTLERYNKSAGDFGLSVLLTGLRETILMSCQCFWLYTQMSLKKK